MGRVASRPIFPVDFQTAYDFTPSSVNPCYIIKMNLTFDQIGALQHLSARQQGRDRFVAITPAQALTGLGLAERTRQGWSITGEGKAWLDAHPRAPGQDPSGGEVLPFTPRARSAPLH